MRSGLVVSSILHAVVLTWGLWALSAPEPLKSAAVDSLPVDLVPIEEYSQSMVGKKDAPKSKTPAPLPTKKPAEKEPAQNVGDNSTDLQSPPTPTERPKATEEAAPPAASEPPPPQPKVQPKAEAVPTPSPEPTPQPKAAPAKTAPPKASPRQVTPDPVEAAIASADAQPQPRPQPEDKPSEPQVAGLPESGPVPTARPTPPTPERSEAKDRPDKPIEKPAQKAPDKSDFDPNKIAALINKEKSAGGGAKRSQQQASLGGERRTGNKLSQSELDALRGQVSRCWSPPAGVSDAGSLRVTIRMRLDPSGGLEGRPELVDGGNGSPMERAAGEAALRAVMRCAPYNLPADKYDTWSEVILNFDPSQML
ncbi:hypothetical protein LQ948_15560 [Jiella sp. MQZ9-1]|uniref:Colicin import membrane protein n=1 Tax=Jiella flava TaxID=2816857 RepID=A0A939G0C8_9HYPH|nr:cell envelope integrity protein TolA [Jiella flava]MBO0664051.1 hypothetical protein [Jiella flava]MCD2472623.1 hypothetical protein [Jiella flava]